jgi:predicted metal-dependent enzyme (double-stranded beta helix superfamily)
VKRGAAVSASPQIQPALVPLALAAKEFCRGMHRVGGSDTNALVVALRDAVGTDRGWLRREHRVGDPARYMRHLLYVDPEDEFVITAITWLPGQQSPVHGHYVWCAYGVAEGELVEETFRAPGKLLEPLGSKTIRAGEVAEFDLGGPIYHRVANHAARPLVTLHLYGVASNAITTGINRIFGEP